MRKAKLIKRHEVTEREQAKKLTRTQKTTVQKTLDTMATWINTHHGQREDPRKAFAALFAETQPQ